MTDLDDQGQLVAREIEQVSIHIEAVRDEIRDMLEVAPSVDAVIHALVRMQSTITRTLQDARQEQWVVKKTVERHEEEGDDQA